MGTQVKFDYSLTNGIVSEDEIKSMAKIAKDAKDVLVSKRSLHAFRKQQRRLNLIQRFFS